MTERVRPLIAFQRKRGKVEIEIMLPAERDEGMIRDAISRMGARTDLGGKASWLLQMLEAVPPAFWYSHSGLTISEILSARINGDWDKLVFESLGKAAIRHQAMDWFEAMLNELATNRRKLLDGFIDYTLYPESTPKAL
jgi:hypothetical protein